MNLDSLKKTFSIIKTYNLDNEIFDYYTGKYLVRPPRHLLFITTKKCNSRCIMCNIWKERDFSQELNINEWKKIITSPLLSKLNTITFSGGEACLRSDLPEIIKTSIQKNLSYIGIATNGLNPINTKNCISKIINVIKKYPKIKLAVQISLDSPNDIHAKIRGIPDAFTKVSETIKQLDYFRKSFPNLFINLSCVMMNINIDNLEKLYSFASENNSSIIFSPAVSSAEYYKNDKNTDITLNKKSKEKAVKFLKNIINNSTDPNIEYYQEVVIPILQGSTRKRQCMMGINSLVIEQDGSIPFCINAEQWTSGKIKDNLNKNWKFIHKLKRNKEIKKLCSSCPAACGYGGFTFSQMIKLFKEN